MTRKVGSVVVSLACMLAAGSGCGSQQTGIADLDPYVGRRPAPIRRLPPPRHREPRAVRATPIRGTLPAGGISRQWDCVVIHHSGSDRSSPQSMRDYHVNERGWQALGYHFAIGNGVAYGDGQIHVGERWSRQMQGAHCKTPGNHYNEHGIGICLIGNLENHSPTEKQVRSLARLVSFLCEKCGIPRSRILTHGGVTNKTACPGRYFSLKPIFTQMSLQSVSASSK